MDTTIFLLVIIAGIITGILLPFFFILFCICVVWPRYNTPICQADNENLIHSGQRQISDWDPSSDYLIISPVVEEIPNPITVNISKTPMELNPTTISISTEM
ncbi:unnamed protein product [Bursaphelenchus okinawaensis]|uniref:Uncharacterized protein n=1 Tax=Bursaphelenchus okinawaensis TaxID=465554 RepID=A0A811LR75_9BILA|nr:unnamed protein product [Bursaphelenchus okinawaensis]CAG9127308.1 unnamed protein product [Bursaphelenchus okinawaensis]